MLVDQICSEARVMRLWSHSETTASSGNDVAKRCVAEMSSACGEE